MVVYTGKQDTAFAERVIKDGTNVLSLAVELLPQTRCDSVSIARGTASKQIDHIAEELRALEAILRRCQMATRADYSVAANSVNRALDTLNKERKGLKAANITAPGTYERIVGDRCRLEGSSVVKYGIQIFSKETAQVVPSIHYSEMGLKRYIQTLSRVICIFQNLAFHCGSMVDIEASFIPEYKAALLALSVRLKTLKVCDPVGPSTGTIVAKRRVTEIEFVPKTKGNGSVIRGAYSWRTLQQYDDTGTLIVAVNTTNEIEGHSTFEHGELIPQRIVIP